MKHDELTMSRTISASPEDVFDAWMDPKCPGGLWFDSEHVIISPIVDGLFYVVFEHEGRYYHHYGRFIDVDRPRRIEHTWMSEATRGIETVVTFTLESRDGCTNVTLRQTGFTDDESLRKHEGGWTTMLSALTEHFASLQTAVQRAN